MLFEKITQAPPDAILGLTEAFKKDTNPGKVNLGVGVYVDDEGRTPVLRTVKESERRLIESEKTKSYLPITGSPEYGSVVQELLFGADHPLLKANRVRTAHTPGGTGGLRVGAEFLKKFAPAATVWLSAPTWPNHKGIFAAAGFKTADYPYYDPGSHGLNASAMLDALQKVPEGDVVLLHVCCHNPTGVDLDAGHWAEVARIAAARRWIPFFDFAYQGFGAGIVEDRAGLAPISETGVDFLVSSSFSKNFGLYQDRVGALSIVAANNQAADAAFSHIKTVVRVIYSNPPAHGGSVVTTILKDTALRMEWEKEVAGMRDRIARVRRELVGGLSKRHAVMDFSFITRQKGMFSFSGLSDAQVAYLREKKSVYMVGGGRINVAGITARNLDYTCDAIIEALQKA
ncbi:MAG TPA: amino acid aminotransferase [Kiritimatiellia bacterium]|nr:amino acid aminotransferase [Kiritimatiellia bacterium]